MLNLPVIVGFGGINSAGRSSFHHGFRRILYEQLSDHDLEETFTSLAIMMGLVSYHDKKLFNLSNYEISSKWILSNLKDEILDNTLIRKIHSNVFDPDKVLFNKSMEFQPVADSPMTVKLKRKDLPDEVPENWEISEFAGSDGDLVLVKIHGSLNFLLPNLKKLLVQSAGQLPTGFNPGQHYKSNHHPKGLQMTIYGASDAIYSLGFEWDHVLRLVRPDQIGVYASSSMGQMDEFGGGGYSKASSLGKRPSSKQLPLAFADMPADFINAYLLGNVGHTSSTIGACASFLYNLYNAVQDIQMGRRRATVVGNSEASLVPEIIEGYRVVSALAEDNQLLQLDSHLKLKAPNHRRACRPFSKNAGFTIAESSQFVVLFDDKLALEMGAQIHGSVAGVNVNADGFKKSITQPGIGNLISLAQNVGLVRSILGSKALKHGSFVHAHGTGTPQNRVTESHCLDQIANQFGIQNWPVSAIKSYVGHSIGSASGDQLTAILGTWKYGWIPGITSIDGIADDVFKDHLNILTQHLQIDPSEMKVGFINAKGFGGNNATGAILSPLETIKLIEEMQGHAAFLKYQRQSEPVEKDAKQKDQEITLGIRKPIYKYGENVLSNKDMKITSNEIKIPGFVNTIDLNTPNPYE